MLIMMLVSLLAESPILPFHPSSSTIITLVVPFVSKHHLLHLDVCFCGVVTRDSWSEPTLL
jgi:hypothetical protein